MTCQTTGCLHSFELVWSESLFGLFHSKNKKTKTQINIEILGCVWEGLFCSSHIGPKPPKGFSPNHRWLWWTVANSINLHQLHWMFSVENIEISRLWPNCQKTVLEHCVWMRGQDKMVWPPKVDTTLVLFRRVLPEWNQWCRTLHTA